MGRAEERPRQVLRMVALIIAMSGNLGLTVNSNQIWASRTIPACFENPDGSNVQARGWIQSAVEETWEANSRLDLTGWGACTASSKGIRMKIDPESTERPHASGGPRLDGRPNGVVLNLGYVKEACNLFDQENCTRFLAVHEFGHVLGFGHEHARRDVFSSCVENLKRKGVTRLGTAGDRVLTRYDPFSVMNYCDPSVHARQRYLSALDIEGLTGVYGLAPNARSACTISSDCPNARGSAQRGEGCCGGVCQPLHEDWAGVFYCDAQCVGRAGASARTCPLRNDGESCKTQQDCANWNGDILWSTGCCNGSCQAKKKDWAGAWYCPGDCTGRSGASPGTCPLKQAGQACRVNQDCAAFGPTQGCCGGTCQSKKKDWAGVWYCPADCVGGFGGRPGSC